MSPSAIAAIVAATAVLSCVLSTLALTYRVGKLIGTTETLVTQSAAERTQLREDVGNVRGQLDRHEQWHMGPGPAVRRGRT